jgi:hypothetical protein
MNMAVSGTCRRFELGRLSAAGIGDRLLSEALRGVNPLRRSHHSRPCCTQEGATANKIIVHQIPSA